MTASWLRRSSTSGPHAVEGPGDRSVSQAAMIGVLVVLAAGYGLAVPEAYRVVPDLTRATWRAQDVVSLAGVPVLVVAAARAAAGSARWHIVMVGTCTWYAYCYAHLAFAVPFQRLFLVYVAVLLLAGFGMVDGLVRVDATSFRSAFGALPGRAAAWFLGVAGIGVAGLWLSDVVPALIRDALPANVFLAELPNPTWVLDLAWIVPAALAAARLARRDHPAAPLVAGSLLVMLLALSAAMLVVTPVALAAGLGHDPAVRPQLVAFTVVFAVLGAFEAWLLVVGARARTRRVDPWRAHGWWQMGDARGGRADPL
jgi:hypothetical protein